MMLNWSDTEGPERLSGGSGVDWTTQDQKKWDEGIKVTSSNGRMVEWASWVGGMGGIFRMVRVRMVDMVRMG